MPKISQAESARRRDEIIDSCAALYEAHGYHDITMAQVAEGVSCGRANIYNYFQCKDEIMLALLQREHEQWADDLDTLAETAAGGMGDAAFADALAGSLEPRGQMLKLLALSLYDMEQNSSLEALVKLKRAYGRALGSLRAAVGAAKPAWDAARIERFTFGFMPFLHGAHPYAHHTEKQLAAMRAVGIASPGRDVRALVAPLVLQLLKE